MRFIKLAILSFIFLFLLVTVISLFIPSRIRISKAIDIHASKEYIVSQLTDPVQWKKWYPGPDSLLGVLVDQKDAGCVVMENNSKHELLVHMKNDSVITAVYSCPIARKIKSGWNIFTGNSIDSVTVQWWMDFRLRWYPWEKFSALFFENIYGAQMEKGLENLKYLLESNHSSLN